MISPTRSNFIGGRPCWPAGRCWLSARKRRVPDRAVRAVDAAVVVRAAVLIDQPVVGHDAGKARRVVGRHQPLRHRVVRLADAADAAVAPRLLDDPGDQLEIVLLLVEPHEAELALGLAGAAHVGVHVGVALADVPFDRPGLAPQKQRIGRHLVHLVLVGRGRKQRRELARRVRPVDAERNLDAVAHGDGDAFFDFHLVVRHDPSTRHARPCAGHPRLLVCCNSKDVDGRDNGSPPTLLAGCPVPAMTEEGHRPRGLLGINSATASMCLRHARDAMLPQVPGLPCRLLAVGLIVAGSRPQE